MAWQAPMALPKKENFDAEPEEVVLYCRYSSHKQREISIEQQIRECTRYADQLGFKIVHIYADKALSGTSDKRPEFQQMIEDAGKATSNWRYVLVYALDRFARDRYDSAVYKRRLRECGVKVLSVTEPFSDDPSSVILESVLEGMAEYYSKELSRKIRRGQEANALVCKVNGAVPFGYRRSADGYYEIDEFEAGIVREIFNRVAEGELFIDIIKDLNSRGILTKKKKPWNKSSFNSLLSNPRYKGIYIWNNYVVPDGILA